MKVVIDINFNVKFTAEERLLKVIEALDLGPRSAIGAIEPKSNGGTKIKRKYEPTRDNNSFKIEPISRAVDPVAQEAIDAQSDPAVRSRAAQVFARRNIHVQTSTAERRAKVDSQVPEGFLSIPAFADAVGKKPATIYNWVKEGKVMAEKVPLEKPVQGGRSYILVIKSDLIKDYV